MRNKILFLLLLLSMHGCSFLPGMQDIEATTIQKDEAPNWFKVKPIIIPITPWFLLNHPQDNYQYHLGTDDILNIIVYKQPDFDPFAQTSNTTTNPNAGAPGYLINHNGNVYLPLIGNVTVGGKTITQARKLITKRLQYYLRHPQVMLRVADFRSQKIYVMGEVMKPGFLPLTDQPISIIRALNLAGSFDPNAADPRHIYVIRGSITRPKIYWLNAATPTALLLGQKFYLQDNDIVIVSTAVVTRWNRFLNQLLPTLQSVWYTKTITGK